MLLRRLDKRKDRVEISVEQLSNASTVAEDMAKETGRPLRIVGWYHSHPHITVWPSHVDVQTQAMYQMMDQTFIGLIFSCFNESKVTLQHTVEMTCFQSASSIGTKNDWDSRQYQRVEIPVYIRRLPTTSSSNLQTFLDLPKILVQEENDAYHAVKQTSGDHILTKIHNASVHAQVLCNITETVTSPLLHLLAATAEGRKEKLAQVEAKNKDLEEKIAGLQKQLEVS